MDECGLQTDVFENDPYRQIGRIGRNHTRDEKAERQSMGVTNDVSTHGAVKRETKGDMDRLAWVNVGVYE
jgi:hypothetical protein